MVDWHSYSALLVVSAQEHIGPPESRGAPTNTSCTSGKWCRLLPLQLYACKSLQGRITKH